MGTSPSPWPTAGKAGQEEKDTGEVRAHSWQLALWEGGLD